MNKHSISAFVLVLMDWLMAILAWALFFSWRKRIEVPDISWGHITQDSNLIKGVIVIPLVWILIFTFFGSYKEVLRSSRLTRIQETIIIVALASIGLLLTVLSDDLLLGLKSYVYSFFRVFGIHVGLFLIGRLLVLTILKLLIYKGVIPWKVAIWGASGGGLPEYYDVVQEVSKLEELIPNQNIEEIIVNQLGARQLNRLIPHLIGQKGNVGLLIHDKLWPQLEYDYKLIPRVRMSYATLLSEPMMWWQKHIKRLGDILGSGIALLVLTPMMAYLIIRIRASSRGSFIYRQERLGRGGIPFQILKFRTMYEDAENDGPTLAMEDDDRCTPEGKWMRRWRLDEIPQFYNVLRGDMSIVGPRPERPFYSRQLEEAQYLYPLIWQVRPGITSWGQIKFGYAASIPEMLQRFRFDLLYIRNRNLFLDIRILYYTVIVLLQGKGR